MATTANNAAAIAAPSRLLIVRGAIDQLLPASFGHAATWPSGAAAVYCH
jgi:hypothetical protein